MPESDSGPLGGLRVLVAEDELMIAMLFEDMLEELKAEIVGPVKSTAEALRAIEEDELDAAMLDVNLRGGRAYTAAAELRAQSIPFIFVSGYTDLPDCPPELRDAPRVKKPCRLDELANALEEAIAHMDDA